MLAQLRLPFDGGLSRLPPKIRSRIDIDENGCWIFEGARSSGGYARIGPTKAHRLIWEILRGPVPDGHVLDHVWHLKRGARACLICCRSQARERAARARMR